MAETSVERFDGPTPNGGVYAIVMVHDGHVEITEYDANDLPIMRTYGMTGS